LVRGHAVLQCGEGSVCAGRVGRFYLGSSHGGSVGDDGIEFEIIGRGGSVEFVSEGIRSYFEV
jgi:hypothetical protein